MKLKKYFFLLLTLQLFSLCTCCSHSKNISTDEVDNIDNSKKSSILFAGDVLIHDDELKAAYNESNKSYNFNEFFSSVKDYISNADLSICNSETCYLDDGSPYCGYPTFNSPNEVLDSLKYSGFDVLASAHNHILDTGTKGFNSTSKAITEKGFDLLGIKNDENDKNYLVKDLNGIKVGITNYTYSTENKSGRNSVNKVPIPNPLENRLNYFAYDNLDNYVSKMNATIDNMKKDGAEFIIFYIHWGDEYKTVPNKSQEALAKALNKCGVDVIIGSHPHVVQPIKTITNENSNKSTLVFYSLGNFVSNQRLETMGNEKSEDGLMVKLNLIKSDETGEVSLKSYDTKPTWVNKYLDKDGKLHYKILSIEDILEDSNKEEYSEDVFNKIKNSYSSTKEIINS